MPPATATRPHFRECCRRVRHEVQHEARHHRIRRVVRKRQRRRLARVQRGAAREVFSGRGQKSFRRLDAEHGGRSAAAQDRGSQRAGAATDVQPAQAVGQCEPREKPRRHVAAPASDVPLVRAAALPVIGGTLVGHGSAPPGRVAGARHDALPGTGSKAHQYAVGRGPAPQRCSACAARETLMKKRAPQKKTAPSWRKRGCEGAVFSACCQMPLVAANSYCRAVRSRGERLPRPNQRSVVPGQRTRTGHIAALLWSVPSLVSWGQS